MLALLQVQLLPRHTVFLMVQYFQTTKSDSLLMLSSVYDFLELQKYDGDG